MIANLNALRVDPAQQQSTLPVGWIQFEYGFSTSRPEH